LSITIDTFAYSFLGRQELPYINDRAVSKEIVSNEIKTAKEMTVEELRAGNEEYYNSDDLDFDIICVLLATGRRKPKNDEEKRILEQIKEIQSRGRGVEFPFD